MKRVTKLSDLKNIKAPEYLKIQTLEKARQTKTINYKKRILAAACAFIIAFTGVYSYQKNNGISNEITNSFGLVAYAANTGEIIKPQDNILVFEEGGGIDSTIGFFTGCLFKITGENIEKVKISLDADGGIYRSKTFTEQDISLEEIQEIDKAQYEAMWNSEDIGIAGAQVCKNEKTKGSDLILPVYDEISEKWYVETLWKLDNQIEETYDDKSTYGFWLNEPPIAFEETDLQKAWHERIDLLEGVKMYVTVTFTDGQVQTQTYTLHSGKLAVEYNEEYQIDLDLFDSSRHLTGKLAVSDEPYIYGVYAELES